MAGTLHETDLLQVQVLKEQNPRYRNLDPSVLYAILAGRAGIMAELAPLGEVAQSGTYSGHQFGVLAALATLRERNLSATLDWQRQYLLASTSL